MQMNSRGIPGSGSDKKKPEGGKRDSYWKLSVSVKLEKGSLFYILRGATGKLDVKSGLLYFDVGKRCHRPRIRNGVQHRLKCKDGF